MANGTNGKNGGNGNGKHVATKAIPEAFIEVLRHVCLGKSIPQGCASEEVDLHDFYTFKHPDWAGKLNYALQIREWIRKEVCEGRVFSAAKQDWRAASWYLEAHHPEEWSKKLRVDQNSDGKLEIVIRHIEAETCNDSDRNEVEVIRN